MRDTMFVGLDVHKATISVAVASATRGGEVRHWGSIPNRGDHVRKLVEKLEARARQLHFCYEAGPCGYGLHRQTDRARACLRRGGAVADPGEERRSGEDRSPGRGEAGQAPSGRRTDRGLGAGRGPRGDARSGAGAGEWVETGANLIAIGNSCAGKNQPFRAWDRIFHDKAVTVAAIDRLVHHATILEMNVDSYRRRAAADRTAVEIDTTPTTTDSRALPRLNCS